MQELEKIREEIKDELKDIYLDIANNYNISDLQYDGDKVTCLASKFRCDAGKRIEKIIRKHMNDGWIPTKERMPTKEECERDNIRFLISVGVDCCYSTEVARCTWVEANNIDGTDGSYSEFWINQFPHIYRPSHRLIAAWKILELPEPYIPRKER